jgi:hypothetical protein
MTTVSLLLASHEPILGPLLISAGPIFGGLLLLLALVVVLTIALQIIECFQPTPIPPALVHAIREHAREGGCGHLLSACESHPSLLGDVLREGLLRLDLGFEAARIAALLRLDVLRSSSERGLQILRTIAFIAPLIGVIATALHEAVFLMQDPATAWPPIPVEPSYEIGIRLGALIPAAMLSLVAVLAVFILQRLQHGIVLRVRVYVVNALLDCCTPDPPEPSEAVRAASSERSP